VACGSERLTAGVVVLVNPESAGGRTRRRWPRIAHTLEHTIGPFEYRFTERPRHASALAREVVLGGSRLLVSVGGDGTHGEIVNGLLEATAGAPPAARPALGIVPSGTGNDLARSLGLPRGIDGAIARLASGTERSVDAGRVSFESDDGGASARYFVNVADFGLSGEVVRRVNRGGKVLPGKATFFVATVAAMLAWKNRPMRLVFDGGAEVWEGIFREVAVANGRTMGGGMVIAPDARMDDGLFDVVALGDFGFGATLALAPAIYRGKLTRDPRVRRRLATRFEAHAADSVSLAADGESLGRLPATFEVLPAALRVLM
jgi:diacylglycerol kinase (ATP)